MDAAAAQRRRATRVVIGCYVCQLGLGYSYFLEPLAPSILEETGWSRAVWSSARAPQLFLQALASPVAGALCVRLGAPLVLSAGVVLLGLSLALLACMQSLWQLYALCTLLGVALTGFGDVTVGAVIAQWVERRRGLVLGIVYSAANVGGMLLQPFGAALAAETSWRIAASTGGALAVAVMLPFSAFVVRDRPRASASTLAPEGDARRPGDDLDLAAALRTRSFWILFFALFCCFFYYISLIQHLILFLVDAGLSQVDAASYSGSAIGVGIFIKIGFGYLADRLPRKSALLFNTGLLTTSGVFLLLAPAPVFLWLFLAGYGISIAARDVLYPLMTAECFGTRYLAQIYGALMLALLPGGVLGPIFAGWVRDLTGTYQPAFASFALLNLLALLALTRLEPRAGEGA